MATHGEIRWPPMGRSGGRQRGGSVAAYGELAMAAVTTPLDRQDPKTDPPGRQWVSSGWVLSLARSCVDRGQKKRWSACSRRRQIARLNSGSRVEPACLLGERNRWRRPCVGDPRQRQPDGLGPLLTDPRGHAGSKTCRHRSEKSGHIYVGLVMAIELSQPDLSVIVVTHNRSDLALRTIRSGRAAMGNLRVEWHVVDSGSDEPIAERIERQWPDIHVRRRENTGFAAANNDALRRAEGRYVLLLNPDVEIAAGTLESLVAALDARPDVGMASVIQRGPNGSIDYSMRRDPRTWRSLSDALVPGRLSELCGLGEIDTRKRRYQSERSADWLCGAFLIARAKAVQEVGPLDERFFLYSEETDWCYRCRCAGWDVRHLPVMAVVHHRSKGYRPDLLAQLSYSRLLFARKHYDLKKAEMLRRADALHHLVRAAAFGAAGLLRRTSAERARAERRALSVVLGWSLAPFGCGDSGLNDSSLDGAPQSLNT